MTKKQKYYEYLYRRLVLEHSEWNGKDKFVHREMKLPSELKELLDQIFVKWGISTLERRIWSSKKF